MRCFIGFFGLTRALSHTAGAIRTGFYEPLQQAGIEMVRVGHFNIPDRIHNTRSGEVQIPVDRRDTALLDLDLCWAEPQDDRAIVRELDAARAYPDIFRDHYASLTNLCHQLRSLRRLWSLMTLLGVAHDDVVLLLRPDLLYLDRLEPREDLAAIIDGRAELIVPAWQGWGGLNDRFSFCSGRAAEVYATRIRHFAAACQVLGGMHPESFLRFVAQHHGLRVAHTGLRAVRLRANGQIAANDRSMICPPVQPEMPTAEPEATPVQTTAVPARPITPPVQAAAAPALPAALTVTRSDTVRTALQRITVGGLPRVSPLRGVHYLQFLAGLHRNQDVRRYLEIGTQTGQSLQCATGRAVAIDPMFRLDKALWARRPGIRLFEMTSDAFFRDHNPAALLGGPIDLAFIDGMHRSEFVLRDFANVEPFCAAGSTIVLHDVIPMNHEMTERERRPQIRRDKALAAAWTGDVWRVLPILRRFRPDLSLQVVDCPPTGLLVVRNLDPHSDVLRASLDEVGGALARAEPPEAEFWAFIDSLAVTSSASLVA